MFHWELFTMMAVDVNTKDRTIQFSSSKGLFEITVRNLAGRWYDVSPDGHFLMNTSAATMQAQNFKLLVNWTAELKK